MRIAPAIDMSGRATRTITTARLSSNARPDVRRTASKLYAFGGYGRRRGASAGHVASSERRPHRARDLSRTVFCRSSNRTSTDGSAIGRTEGRSAGVGSGTSEPSTAATRFSFGDRQQRERLPRQYVGDVVRRRRAACRPVDDDARPLPRSRGLRGKRALRVAFGAEFRADRYEITAGELRFLSRRRRPRPRRRAAFRRRDSPRSARRCFPGSVRPMPAHTAGRTERRMSTSRAI